MGIWVFLDAWKKYDHFLLFLLLVIGEAVWVGMEIYCLQRGLVIYLKLPKKTTLPGDADNA